ncbi:MAG: hypothetical protein ACYSWO_03500 [Planctomycetota bacterium]|jgi:hypothetical protein
MSRKLFLLTSFALALSLVSANAALGVVWEGQITSGNDAVEEESDGNMYMTSSDLELIDDGNLQVIGLRWLNVEVPKGAIISSAYIEFTVDETESPEAVNLIVEGELDPDPPTFASIDYNVSSRSRTVAQVKWSPPDWPTVGEKQRSEDISPIIAEIVSQDGWAMGNSIVIIIYDDPDAPSVSHRTAESGTGAVSPLLHIEYTSMLAHKPDPRDGSLYSDTWANLTWQAGENAVSHDVYFSDDFDAVNDGTADAFVGNQGGDFVVVGFPGMPFPDGLVPGTTYYWRVDEVEADGVTKQRGAVWSFGIPPKTAYAPDPADGAEFVDPNADLTWTPGFNAKLHTVYVGTSLDDVNNAAGGIPQGFSTYSPGPLELEKVYYWRVDEFDPPFTYKGDVWAFTTPGAVGNAQPANGAVDVQLTATLTWTAADNAASHELYFGTDAEAVGSATTASPEYVGPKALGAESYDPGGLTWHGSYAWRVDEVYPTETIKGLVWTFTAADFLLVDDFEAYNDIDPPDPNSNRIFDKWIDGFGTTTNGALVGNDMPPYAEQVIVHGGDQSMIYSFDNAGKTSEATLTLVYPRDWTAEGVARLSLWVRGNSSNAADQIFVALNGTTAVYHDDPAATQLAGWNEWVIDLAAFGVDLANVDSITIGVGTKGSPSPAGGAGTLYFDDIRLIR